MILTIITVIAIAVGVALLRKAEYDEGVLFGLGLFFSLSAVDL